MSNRDDLVQKVTSLSYHDTYMELSRLQNIQISPNAVNFEGHSIWLRLVQERMNMMNELKSNIDSELQCQFDRSVNELIQKQLSGLSDGEKLKLVEECDAIFNVAVTKISALILRELTK